MDPKNWPSNTKSTNGVNSLPTEALDASLLEGSVAGLFKHISTELSTIKRLEVKIADIDSQIIDLQAERLRHQQDLDRAKFLGSPTLEALVTALDRL